MLAAPSSWAGAVCAALSRWRLHLHWPQQFPGRDLIVLCAFCVVLDTLVIQGFTLLRLTRLLRFGEDGAVERELSRARVAVMQAALDSLDGETSPAAIKYAAARKVAEDQTSCKLLPNTTNCGYARSPPSARHCNACGRGARLGKKPFTAFRKSSTVRARCCASRKLSIAGELT
jgi:hypothetical protein